MGDILRFRRQKRKNTSVVTLAMLGLTGGIALGSGILYFRSHPVSFASIAPVAMMTPVETANTAERDTIGCSNPHVVDGDTLRCGATRIRLHGIDAPETDGHCRVGRECAPGDPVASTENLRSMVAGQMMECRQTDIDRYGRTVALCAVGDRDLSCEQVRSGNAIRRYAPLSC